MVVSAAGTPAPEMLIRKAMSFARTAASGMIHPAWLTPSSPICVRSISLRVFRYSNGGHHVAGQIVERGRVPVARRSTDTALVVPEDRHAVADQEPRPGKHVFPILGAGAVHENDRGMFPAVAGLMSVPVS